MASVQLPFGSLVEGRAPNPAPLGQSTLALLVNPSTPPRKKKGKKAVATVKKKKRGKSKKRKPNAKKSTGRKANSKNVKVEVSVVPVTKKGTPTKKGKKKTYTATGTRTANGKKRGKRKNNGKKRGRKRNGMRTMNSTLAGLMNDKPENLANLIDPVASGLAAWVVPGLIYVIIPKEERGKLAAYFGEGDVGQARARAVLSGLSLVAAWFGTNKVAALKQRRIPILMGAGIRFAYDLFGALLPKEGLSGNIRAMVGLPEGNYDLALGTTTKGNWQSMTPVAGNFMQMQPSLAGWASMTPALPPASVNGMHSHIRSMHSQGGWGGVGASPLQMGSF